MQTTTPTASQKAFTLVELLVVIGIIALLIAITIPVLGKARRSALQVQCGSNLRQLYIAQNLYHDAYRRYTPVNHLNNQSKSWVELLRPYIAKNSKGFDNAMFIVSCPSVDADEILLARYSYGLNTFTDLPTWAGQRHRRANSPTLILLADKGLGESDSLRTEGGFAFYYANPVVRWINEFQQHSNAGSFRHAAGNLSVPRFTSESPQQYNPTGYNALMADGHIERLSRRDLLLDSGRWMIGNVNELPRVLQPGDCCQ